ncbi:MAG: class SAM-dependent methyltransferase [Aeromicrobium sp.]|uniref:class I SAM-dependent methyltransferase n=1 Tax=Aeromicrobium sp. TaxID=1871063 RepID=UPI00261F2360|nr:class I SAM-dependent methyltransferase [Aeromicrobium sp.]MCW2825806.1 class SAM-dependent methyltransferase [Aeromicrobium sp.]
MDADQLTERLFGSTLGALDVFSIHLGDRLGLYAALREHGPLTAAGLAERAGIAPRYAREWLEQQTVAGFLEVEDAAVAAEDRRFVLPAEHVGALADRDSIDHFVPFIRVVATAASRADALVEAYRTGGGVPWEAFGPNMRTGQAEGNKPAYLRQLAQEWLPAVPGLVETLDAGARVADVGCGEGWSSIAMALGFPAITVDGIDIDAASVEAAAGHAAAAGVGDRVTFRLADAGATATDGTYDLVTAFECIHDLPDPVAVLRSMRGLVRPGGVVMVMDERVPETYTGRPEDPVEQLMYGFSIAVCLPDSMSTSPSRATGTVMRPSVLRGYAVEAGFADAEVLPIEHDLWRFYRLVG